MSRKIDSSDYPEIVRLYQEEKLSQAEIGLRFGVSGQAISGHLKKAGVETRVGASKVPRSQVEEQKKAAKLLYDAGASTYEIASTLKRTPQTVHEHLKNLGVRPRSRNDYEEKPKQSAIRAEVLLNLWRQGMSGRNIAKLIGVSSARIHERLRKFPQYKLHHRIKPNDEDAVAKKISELAMEGKSRGDIATELGISYHTVQRLVQSHKITVNHAQSREDLTNKIFGRWQVLSALGYKTQDGYSSTQTTKDNSYYWNCKCLGCGKVKPVSNGNLRSGKSKACLSCAAKERHKTRTLSRTDA